MNQNKPPVEIAIDQELTAFQRQFIDNGLKTLLPGLSDELRNELLTVTMTEIDLRLTASSEQEDDNDLNVGEDDINAMLQAEKDVFDTLFKCMQAVGISNTNGAFFDALDAMMDESYEKTVLYARDKDIQLTNDLFTVATTEIDLMLTNDLVRTESIIVAMGGAVKDPVSGAWIPFGDEIIKPD